MSIGLMPAKVTRDRYLFEHIIDTLRSDLAIAAGHMTIDGASRAKYNALIRRYAGEIRAEAEQGRITWSNAAERASGIRNVTMELLRGQSTPVGCAIAEKLKRFGKTFNEMIAKKSLELFGPGADFTKFNPQQRDRVFRAIVESAGRSVGA